MAALVSSHSDLSSTEIQPSPEAHPQLEASEPVMASVAQDDRAGSNLLSATTPIMVLSVNYTSILLYCLKPHPFVFIHTNGEYDLLCKAIAPVAPVCVGAAV